MRRRSLGLFFICSAVVPLAIVSTAWACGVLATLEVSPNTVSPNQVVTASGVNYSGSSGQPVTIKWNSRKGRTLDTTFPDPTGKINTAITIPSSAKPGDNLVLALQNNANGTPKSGTPGRTTVDVVVSNTRRSKSKKGEGVIGAWGPSAPAGPGGAGATVTLDGGAPAAGPALLPLLLGGLLSAGLLGTGLALVRRPRAGRPALGL